MRRKSDLRRLDEAIDGADIFLGLSAPGVLKPEMVAKMARDPLILALANPVPEIWPETAREARPDAIIATGRSDYPNQVNNVLCFPFIFRGALDVGATTINEEMKLACVRALADLAKAEASEVVVKAYGGQPLQLRARLPDPRGPSTPRLILEIAPAVAEAAMDSGVARRPIADFRAYREELNQFVFRSGLLMKPVFEQARRDPKRGLLRRGRGRAGAARGADPGRRGAGPADHLRPAPGGGDAPEGAGACASAPASTSNWSTRSTTRATATTGPSTTR